MYHLPGSIILTIAVLTFFLGLTVVIKYSVEKQFSRMRLIMTAFFFFIIATLTISFWQFTMATLPFTIPAWIIGAVVGYFTGVRAAEHRLKSEGQEHYMEHFAEVEMKGGKFKWWDVVNFYTVASALILINLVGLSTVIFRGAEGWAIITSMGGAFLLGTIAPYLVHLWRIRVTHKATITKSE